MSAVAVIRREVRARAGLWLTLVIAFFVLSQLLQLALLVVRFQEFPNYLIVHDWAGNIARIVHRTPAITDMISIGLDQWFIETGSMNYDYGHGVAEWSFVLVPAKAAVMLAIALLLATDVVLLRAAGRACPLPERLCASFAAASGTLVAGLSTMTITWVACCAAPNWVVGLSLLGMSVATAFELTPIGGWLSLLGILLLGTVTMALAWMVSAPGGRAQPNAMPMPVQFERARS